MTFFSLFFSEIVGIRPNHNEPTQLINVPNVSLIEDIQVLKYLSHNIYLQLARPYWKEFVLLTLEIVA